MAMIYESRPLVTPELGLQRPILGQLPRQQDGEGGGDLITDTVILNHGRLLGGLQ